MQLQSFSSSRLRRAAGGLIAGVLAIAAAPEPNPVGELRPTATSRKLVPAPENAQGIEEQRIAAIVNDEVVSYFDLKQRMNLVVSSSGYEPGSEEKRQLEQQVLRGLIDEKLKLQETAHLEVEVEYQEIVEQLQDIAQRSSVTVPDIQADLQKRGISIYTLTDQIKADIAWNKLVQGRFGREVKINEETVAQLQDEARASINQPQYDILEIFLPVDQPQDDQKVLQAARGLLEQLKKGGAFPQLARQFSQAPSAATGGQYGWVTLGQLPAELNNWLKSAHRGALSMEPIRTIGGYYLLGVRDTRNVASGPSSPRTPLFLKRVVVPLSETASADRARQVMAQMNAAASRIHGCNTLADVAKTITGAQIVDVGTKPFAELEPRDQARVARLVSGQASGPGDRTNTGYDMIVLCGHADEQAQGVPEHDDIARRLYDQQMSMLARRYLRDLRRDAVIDNRLGED